MRVIYIAGTSHSGSTLLDLMLNAHPAIFASGEVLKLNRQLKIKDARRGTHAPCSCGAPSLWECRFWPAVDRRTRETSGKSLVDLDMLDHTELDAVSAPNAVVFKAMAEVSGKSFVVDSSKLPGRLSYLTTLKETSTSIRCILCVSRRGRSTPWCGSMAVFSSTSSAMS